MSDITVVGINRTQDASICVARGASELYSLQKERITRRKHHWGRLGDLPNLYRPRMPYLDEPIDLVVECYSSDAEFERVDEYERELRDSLTFRREPRVARISHHLAHVYSAFYPSPFDAAAVMVIDAQRSRAGDVTESFPGADELDPDVLEISSFYAADRTGGLRCVGKQLWDGDWNRPVGLGCFYYLLTRMVFPESEGSEGKLMGLAAFGVPGVMGLPELEVEGSDVFIPEEWVKLFGERERYLYNESKDPRRCADLAAEGQFAFENAILRVAEWLHDQTGLDALCFAGGTALNCSANGRLLRESPFRQMFIPPSPHDGGTAVGLALWGLKEAFGVDSEFRWSNDFLGLFPIGRTSTASSRPCPTR